ncbi:hypothetical protein ACULLL_14865 [Lysinibacillus irui]|uniref:hypothetical protein n=1 Tax=Lysinibacillus irui TaxID=2998077 RepID=UPI004043FE07
MATLNKKIYRLIIDCGNVDLANKSNMQNGIINEIESQGVEIVYKDGNMAYSPISRELLQLVINENSSMDALIYIYTFR